MSKLRAAAACFLLLLLVPAGTAEPGNTISIATDDGVVLTLDLASVEASPTPVLAANGGRVLVGIDDDGAGRLAYLVTPSTAGAWETTAVTAPAATGWVDGTQAIAWTGDRAAITSDHATVYVVVDLDTASQTVAAIAGPDLPAGARFGHAVAITGDILVVGAPFDQTAAGATGAIYLYNLAASQPAWTRFVPPSVQAGDRFGWSLAAHDGQLYVGALGDDTVATNGGAVYAFSINVHGVLDAGTHITAPVTPGAQFGRSLAASSHGLLIGAPLESTTASNAGAAFLHAADGAAGTPERLAMPTGHSEDMVGFHVGWGDDRMLITAPSPNGHPSHAQTLLRPADSGQPAPDATYRMTGHHDAVVAGDWLLQAQPNGLINAMHIRDRDLDGLNDTAETATYATDPRRADSDGDGLSDGAEVLDHGTNPLSTDTDGDCWDDGAEVDGGSDATDPFSMPVPAYGGARLPIGQQLCRGLQ